MRMRIQMRDAFNACIRTVGANFAMCQNAARANLNSTQQNNLLQKTQFSSPQNQNPHQIKINFVQIVQLFNPIKNLLDLEALEAFQILQYNSSIEACQIVMAKHWVTMLEILQQYYYEYIQFLELSFCMLLELKNCQFYKFVVIFYQFISLRRELETLLLISSVFPSQENAQI
eukprot:TRINITY_DN17414_c0_g1_i6.p3 TRINITY_DN17414_c0_g1~~TRINITY_DN17414_c0_g1_i6.p3  ORF type:complete len:173 (+),score=6.85 TRINITY_DN17414_c0_g1_i6:530-1048(+)